MYLNGRDIRLGVIPEELLKEATSHGYSYIIRDYSLILEARGRNVIIQSSGILVEERYYWYAEEHSWYQTTYELTEEELKTFRGVYNVGKRLTKPTEWERSFAERVIDCFVSPSWAVLSSLDTE